MGKSRCWCSWSDADPTGDADSKGESGSAVTYMCSAAAEDFDFQFLLSQQARLKASIPYFWQVPALQTDFQKLFLRHEHWLAVLFYFQLPKFFYYWCLSVNPILDSALSDFQQGVVKYGLEIGIVFQKLKDLM